MIAPTWTSFLIRVYSWMLILGDNGLVNFSLLQMKLIPEPLSTVLFFAAGVIIVGLFIFRKVFRLRNQPRTSSYNRR